RKQVLFALTKAPDPKTGFGTDIYAVNLDGTDIHPVVPHESENVFYDTPRYDPTGAFLYFHRNAAIVKNGTYVGNESTIERINVNPDGTGLRSLAQTGDDTFPAWSADGGSLAYVSTGAFFELSMKDASVKTLASGDNFFFGDITWLK